MIKQRKKEKINYANFLEILRNIASHFCAAKVSYKKFPTIKKQDPLNESLYPDANIFIGQYNRKLDQILVNKHKAVIDLYSKYPAHFLHEIRHSIQPQLKPKEWTAREVLKMKEKEEDDANRWAIKKSEYYAQHPEKWEKLLTEKGKFWEQTYWRAGK